MKIYIDYQNQAITKIDTSDMFEGDVNSNKFIVLFSDVEDPSTRTWYPTLTQLAPNGREAGAFMPDAYEQDADATYVEDGITYLKFEFTINNNYVLANGRSNFFVYVNKYQNGGLAKKVYAKFTCVLNESDSEFFIQDPQFNPKVKQYIDTYSQLRFDGIGTEAQIEALTENKGIWLCLDAESDYNGYYFYWDDTTEQYVPGNIFQATAVADGGITWAKLAATVQAIINNKVINGVNPSEINVSSSLTGGHANIRIRKMSNKEIVELSNNSGSAYLYLTDDDNFEIRVLEDADIIGSNRIGLSTDSYKVSIIDGTGFQITNANDDVVFEIDENDAVILGDQGFSDLWRFASDTLTLVGNSHYIETSTGKATIGFDDDEIDIETGTGSNQSNLKINPTDGLDYSYTKSDGKNRNFYYDNNGNFNFIQDTVALTAKNDEFDIAVNEYYFYKFKDNGFLFQDDEGFSKFEFGTNKLTMFNPGMELSVYNNTLTLLGLQNSTKVGLTGNTLTFANDRAIFNNPVYVGNNILAEKQYVDSNFAHTIGFVYDSTNYTLKAVIYDKNGNSLYETATIDLPIESMVVGAEYDEETQKIILTLQNGQTIEFSVADLVAGLQPEITVDNKLESDLVDDSGQFHKFVTQEGLEKLGRISLSSNATSYNDYASHPMIWTNNNGATKIYTYINGNSYAVLDQANDSTTLSVFKASESTDKNLKLDYTNSKVIATNLEFYEGTYRMARQTWVSSEIASAVALICDGASLNSFADVESALALKADQTTTYTKTEVDTLLNAKQDTLSGSDSIDITSNVVSVKDSYITSQFLTDAEMTTLLSEVFN